MMQIEPSRAPAPLSSRDVSVIARPHPFGTDHETLSVPAGLTIAEIVELAGIRKELHHLVRVELGDHLIPRESWRIRPKPGTRVTILVVPSGGGGGKNVFRIVAMIALAVAAAWLGAQGAIALGFETFAGSGVLTTTGTMVAAGIAATTPLTGPVLINGLMP